ncbi:13407_t:CDS:1 [Dentiscutata erythropus]|uniref:13407_t:CDS:1 n=1 Tax=Dentiscutata erythropus TaxID=1348616 RepID=A0A9N9FE68_9GLOM|nr:13407_t:CDS:1 [Dentiscutata erythropus]
MSNYHTGDIDEYPIKSLSINYIKSSDLSIDYLNDITIEDDNKKFLIESFNYYLKKDQINYKSLDIDDLKISKHLNEIIELQNPLCSKLNDLQRKNLVDLFIHIQHFIQHFIKKFLKKNNLDHTLLKIMRTTANNLGLFYIHQRNVVIGDETFEKVIKKRIDFYEANKNWIIIFVFFLKYKF